jgi:hypothetical protein
VELVVLLCDTAANQEIADTAFRTAARILMTVTAGPRDSVIEIFICFSRRKEKMKNNFGFRVIRRALRWIRNAIKGYLVGCVAHFRHSVSLCGVDWKIMDTHQQDSRTVQFHKLQGMN